MSRAYPTWDGWERQTAPIEGLVKAGCPFALTPTPHSDTLWNVTHIPTGHALAVGILRPERALAVIEVALAAQVDWSAADLAWFAEHRSDQGYQAAIRPVRQAIREAF